VATHFSRLLRHAWFTVGLFLFPGHHTGIISLLPFSLVFTSDSYTGVTFVTCSYVFFS
jgi:hypothetical protein